MVGESRRLSPTAARTAAAELRLPRGRRALSGALHTDAQACATVGKAAPPIRVPRATPGLPTDYELRRMGRPTDRCSTDRPPLAEDPDQEEITNEDQSETTNTHEDHHKD